ncbi:MAG: hypothetical protein HKN12_02950, partial [Gemmatimonadetes bacterium]|nr:hypothetical protein [Gemmatimonadota bacterium]
GSGWKPYNRIKWNLERQLTDGQLPTSDQVLAVWQERSRRQSQTRAAASWFQVGPVNLSGRITTIEFHPTDPNTVYIGSASGGIHKSTDGGLTYTNLGDDLPSLLVGAIAVHDLNPNVVIVGTGEGAGGASGVGVLKSTDGGATWNTTGLSFGLPSGHGFHVMEVNPLTGTVIAGATDGLWRSTDQGDTWTQVKTGGHYYDVKIKPGDPTRMYTCRGSGSIGNQVKKSDDDGLTWTNVGTGQPPQTQVGKTKLAVTPADPNVIYANYVDRSTSQTLGVYKSTDNGSTWTAQNTSLNMTNNQGWYNLTLAVDPDDADHLLAGGVELWESTDAGVTWTSIHSFSIMGTDTDIHWDHHAIAYEPGSNDNVWVGTDGGVWRSTDDGGNWNSRREGLPTYQFYDICVAQSDPIFMLGGSQDNGLTPRNGTDTWTTSTLTADGMVCNINPTNADAVYGEWQFGNHVKSFNGGNTWTDIMNGITGSGAWVAPVDEDQNTPNHLYTSTSAGIFRTTQGGNLWVNVAPHTATWISISQVDGNVVWTSGAGNPWYTTDDGGTWTQTANYGFAVGGTTSKILAHPTDTATAFVTFGGFGASAHVAMTTDFGATWTDVTGDLPAQPTNTMAVDPADPTQWFVGTDFGVWHSSNGGANWLPYETGFPNVVVTDLEIHKSNRKLVAGTYGRGAWEVGLPGGAVDAEVAVSPGPLNLMLDSPAPNPVRDQTWLRFAAKHEGAVTLDIFDVSGRRISRVAEL